jgi:hypothetical protein
LARPVANVSLVFITTLVLLAAIAYTIYRRQRRRDYDTDYELPPPARQALFGEGGAHEPENSAPGERELSALPAHGEGSDAGARAALLNERAALLERAARGDLAALPDARRLGDQPFYDGVLAALVSWAGESRERLSALGESVCAGETPRGSAGLSRAFDAVWNESPDVAVAARALHLAALSDDAGEFERVLDEIVRLRRDAKLAALSPEDLRGLAESQFWVLSAQARASGAAFVLKQKIAALRDEPAARV